MGITKVLNHRAPRQSAPRPPLALELPADPYGLTREHVKALATAVRSLEREIKANKLAHTRWGMQTLTLASDALGRLERRTAR